MRDFLSYRFILMACVLLLGLILSACASDQTADQAILNYLQAMLDGDESRVVSLACAEWEAQANVQVSSFGSLDASLEDASCEVNGTDGDYTRVVCSGHIAVVYGEEEEKLPLGNYRAIQEDGEWKMCGEAAN